MVADSSNVVFEGGAEANNVASDPAPIDVISRPPDLVVSEASAPGTAAADAGLLVDWTVSNKGAGGTVANRWEDVVYASTDAVLGGDVRLGGFVHSGVLAAGESYSRSVLITIPFALVGQYYIFIVTDVRRGVFEGDKEGNNGSLALPVLVEQHTADLQVAGVTVAPVEVGTGQSFTVDWTVQNLGDARTNATHWRDAVFLSTDTAIDAGDTDLGSVYCSGSLEPLEQYSVSRSFQAPVQAAAALYVIVRTDSRDQVMEGADEGNNDLASTSTLAVTLSPVPDLVLETIGAPAQAVSGQTFPVKWNVTNSGGADATTVWYDAFYLSPD